MLWKQNNKCSHLCYIFKKKFSMSHYRINNNRKFNHKNSHKYSASFSVWSEGALQQPFFNNFTQSAVVYQSQNSGHEYCDGYWDCNISHGISLSLIGTNSRNLSNQPNSSNQCKRDFPREWLKLLVFNKSFWKFAQM